MTTAIEDRVEALEAKVADTQVTTGTLEARVKNLETWAGPGQNEALVDNLVGIWKALAEFALGQKKQDRILDQLVKGQERHEKLLTQHSEILTRHGEILDRHGEILGGHTQMLEEILRRLPKPAAPSEGEQAGN